MADVVFRVARRAELPAILALLADDQLGAGREVVGEEVDARYWRAFEQIDADPRNALVVAMTTDKRRLDAHRFYASLGFVASHEGLKLPL